MAYKLIKTNGVFLENVNEFVCDSSADLASIPTTGLNGAAFGSAAFCISEQKTYMMNSSGSWVTAEAAADGDGE